MRGEYDAILRWPFRQKVTFMLLDQDNVEHVIDAFRPDPNSSSFQRPRRETNIASGCPMFCSIEELNNHAYVRDDTMFFKIIVDTSDSQGASVIPWECQAASNSLIWLCNWDPKWHERFWWHS